jgi:hypothetical protein
VTSSRAPRTTGSEAPRRPRPGAATAFSWPPLHEPLVFRFLNLLQLVPRHRRRPAGSVTPPERICSGQPDAHPEEIECSPGLSGRPDPTVTSQQFAMPIGPQSQAGHCLRHLNLFRCCNGHCQVLPVHQEFGTKVPQEVRCCSVFLLL